MKFSFLKFFFRFGAVFLTIGLGGLGLFAQKEPNWLALSFDYLERNRPDSAEIALKTALRMSPDNPLNPFLLNNLGTIQRRLGKKDDALLSYTAALGTYPANTVFLESRASLFAEMGQTYNAILDYSTLLNETPINEEALYQRGLLYLKIKNTGLAEDDFKRMLELNPNGLYARKGFASLAKFRGEYNEAEKIYNYLLDKEPEDPSLYAGRAELYLLMGKPGKAASDANQAIRLSGDTPNPYLYVIRYRAKILLHEKDEALKDLQKAKSMGYEGGEE